MAATQINAVSIVNAEQTPVDLTTGTAADVTNGNATPNNGRVKLLVQVTGTSAETLSVTRTATVDGATLAAHTYTIAASKTVLVGPFDPTVFGPTLTYQATATTTKFIPLAD